MKTIIKTGPLSIKYSLKTLVIAHCDPNHGPCFQVCSTVSDGIEYHDNVSEHAIISDTDETGRGGRIVWTEDIDTMDLYKITCRHNEIVKDLATGNLFLSLQQ